MPRPEGACAAAATWEIFQQLDVLGVLAELVIAHQRAERRAAEDAVLFFVDFLEERALVEFRRPLQIAQQFLLAMR
jgi:hypothetical protein